MLEGQVFAEVNMTYPCGTLTIVCKAPVSLYENLIKLCESYCLEMDVIVKDVLCGLRTIHDTLILYDVHYLLFDSPLTELDHQNLHLKNFQISKF